MTRRINTLGKRPSEARDAWSWDEYVKYVVNGTAQFGLAGSPPTTVAADFGSQVASIGRKHGTVASAVFARQLPLSQIRLRWRRQSGELVNHESLDELNPAQGTRSQFWALAESHVSYAGTAYILKSPHGLRLLDPGRVQVIMAGDANQSSVPHNWEVLGYTYWPEGVGQGPHDSFAANVVSRWLPEPDPQYPWRGLSWVSAIVKEVVIDSQSTDHLEKFFTNAATPNLVYSMDAALGNAQLQEFTEQFRKANEGRHNAYKSIIVGGGADAKIVGSKVAELDMGNIQGGLETRIANRSRVPAVILGIREGLAGSSLNQGNYMASRRSWSDNWFSPVADGLCESLEQLVTSGPRPARRGERLELTYDPDRVLLLQEDRKDAAEILASKLAVIRQGIDAGFDPDAMVAAAMDDNLRELVGKHSGLVSVQLLPPGISNHDETVVDDDSEGVDEDE